MFGGQEFVHYDQGQYWHRAAGNEDQVNVQSVLLKNSRVFRDPDRRERTRLSAITDVHAFELRLRMNETGTDQQSQRDHD